MAVTTRTRWLRSLRDANRPALTRWLNRLTLDALEDRTTPATFTVTTTADSGVGSLRQAILDANARPNSLNAGGVADVVSFNIPGAGVKTLQPLSELAVLTDPVTIDGYTQTGANANTLAVGSDSVLRIVIDGNSVAGGVAFSSTAGGSALRGLVFNRFATSVVIQSNGNAVEGCYFNTNPDGDAVVSMPNGLVIGGGISVVSGDGNRIGG